jgi:hypothetical protein
VLPASPNPPPDCPVRSCRYAAAGGSVGLPDTTTLELQLKRPRPSARRDISMSSAISTSRIFCPKEGAGSVMQVRGDVVCPFDAGRQLAAGIPGAHFIAFPRSKPFVPGACAGLRSILRRDQPFPERLTGRGSVPADVKDQVGLRLRTTVSSHSHRFKRSGHPFILTEFP